MPLIACARCGRIHPWGQCPVPKPVYRTDGRTDVQRFRSSARWQRKAAQILERDAHLCKLCLADGILNNRSLSVHHIIPVTQADDLKLEDGNLITLCRRHHDMVEGDAAMAGVLRELAGIPPGVLGKFGGHFRRPSATHTNENFVINGGYHGKTNDICKVNKGTNV